MIDVALKSHDFLHEIFLLFVGLGDLVGGTTDVFLSVLQLHVDFFVLYGYLFHSSLKSLNLLARVPIVLQNILFFKLQGPCVLLGTALSVN